MTEFAMNTWMTVEGEIFSARVEGDRVYTKQIARYGRDGQARDVMVAEIEIGWVKRTFTLHSVASGSPFYATWAMA